MDIRPDKKKKVLAILVIVIFLPIQLIIFAVLVFELFNENSGKAQTVISFLFTMGIFAFPLWWAISLLKSMKADALMDNTNFSGNMKEVNLDRIVRLQTKIGLSEYRQLVFKITYTTPIFVFLHFIGIAMLIFYMLNGDGNWFALFILIFILYLPIAVYRSAGSNYKATKILHELLSYEFTPDNISVTGESFNSSMQWQTLYKIKELNDWFLLYTNKQVAMMIPKKAFASEADIKTFRFYSANFLNRN